MAFDYEMVLRLVMAALLGSLIGIERERRTWTAGLRTHMLVCVSAALIMVVSMSGFNDVLSPYRVILDPSRVAAQVVSGIGFLGAGIIIFRREAVRGLTTAASIWSVAAIGLAAGCGLYVAAISGTALILLILAGLKPIESRLLLKRRPQRIELTIERNSVAIAVMVAALRKADLALRQIEIEQAPEDDRECLVLVIAPANPASLNAGIEQLRGLAGVRAIRVPMI